MSEPATQPRDKWGSRLGFVLAAAGSAIGLGNLWKFPFITWSNEGGAFVLVYLACITAVGLPIMMAEILVGRKTQKSPVGALREVLGPAWSLVGGLGVLTGFVILSYYAVIAGWTLRYFAICLQWSFRGFSADQSTGGAFGAFAAQGGLQVLLSGLFMVGTMLVIYRGIGGGIERVARLLMPLLFGILVLLLGTALTMDGAGQALGFIFRPDFAKLGAAGTLEALGHAFFTLSLGMGAMITYGSYLDQRESIVRSATIVVVLDTVIAIAATVIMFSVIFSVPGMSESIGKSTVGMLFITLPQLFYTVVPFGVLLAPLFYLLVAFAALTSTISLLEVVTSYFIDQRGMTRRGATTLCGASIFAMTTLCALSFNGWAAVSTFEVFSGKPGVFATLDHLASNWMLPVGGFFITLGVGWFMTAETTRRELVDEGTPRWFRFGVWRFFMRYVAPVAVAAIIIAVLYGKDFS
ncbi:MAG: sodium-dependent transporter [Thermoanaerobaculia bacterium]|nr:sodium-dependent transporter [Thermoanaerobaculia bacterium]